MEKNLKKIRAVAIVLIAILIVVMAFCGVYTKVNGVWKNVIPNFNLGMELNGHRELRFILDPTSKEKEVYVDSEGNYAGDVADNSSQDKTIELEQTEAKDDKATVSKDIEGYKRETRTISVNPEENKTIENFEKSKELIQKRLSTITLNEYNIRQNAETGEIVLEVPDDANIELEEYMVTSKGELKIVDYQTGLILLDNSNIKNAKGFSNSTGNGQAQVYLQLEFDKIGKEKLKEISKTYVATEKESTEASNTETEENSNSDKTQNIKYIEVQFDGQALIRTYFGEEQESGILQLPIGNQTTDASEYKSTAETVSRIVEIVNGNPMPLTYKLSSDNYVRSGIAEEVVLGCKIIFAIVIAIVTIYLVIKYKLEGVKIGILNIAYIGIVSLLIRYTEVIVTINSIIAFVGMVVVNYIFSINYLKDKNSEKSKLLILGQNLKKLYIAIAPLCIFAIVFTFMNSAIIGSIGMTLFWAIAMQLLFSLATLL